MKFSMLTPCIAHLTTLNELLNDYPLHFTLTALNELLNDYLFHADCVFPDKQIGTCVQTKVCCMISDWHM